MSKRKLEESDWLEDNDHDFDENGLNDDLTPDDIDNEVKCIDLQMDELGERSSELAY